MKAPKVKARTVMGWNIAHPKLDGPTMHYVLPADAESYERMVAQVAVVLYEQQMTPCRWTRIPYADQVPWIQLAQDALRAIGIAAPKRGKKGSK